MQQKTKFPWYVAAVSTNEDYYDGPTHCAFELRPSVVFTIFLSVIMAWFAERFLQNFSEIRFGFRRSDLRWLVGKEDSELADQGGVADAETIDAVFSDDDSGLRGYEVSFLNAGSFNFLCYEKGNGPSFFTDGILLREVLPALTGRNILAEISEARFKNMAAE